MKNRKAIYLISGILGFCFVLLTLGFSRVQIADSLKLGPQNNLDLKVSVPKQNYVKGEMVSLVIQVTNASSTDVSLKGADVESGYVKIFVSTSNMEFRQYIPGGVRKKTNNLVLSGDSSFKSQATILWNFAPETKNLSDGAVKTYSDNQLMTDYAFPDAGIYFVKAVLIIPGEIMTKIESPPVQIVISEPIGDNLKVWTRIKENGEIAYFIQQNEFRTYKPEEIEKLLKEVEQLVANNPNSFLASQIDESLAKYRVNEVKRKEFMNKLKKQHKPEN